MNKLKHLILSLMLLFSTANLMSEQTIHGDYRGKKTYYYNVKAPIVVLRGDKPSSFYLANSTDNGVSWSKISNTFTWGNESFVNSWTPTKTTDLGRLGIVTDTNFVPTWSNPIPTDWSDTIKVSYGTYSSMSFSKSTYNMGEQVIIRWTNIPSTLPETLMMQTKPSSGTIWENLSYVKNSSVEFYTTLKYKNQDFRITYLDSGYTLTQGTANYINPTATFSKMTPINKILNSATEYGFGGFLENSNRPIKVLAYDGVITTEINPVSVYIQSDKQRFNFSYKLPNAKTSAKITFYIYSVSESYPLDSLTVNFKYKYISVSNLADFYLTNTPVNLNWTYSDENWVDNNITITERYKPTSTSSTITILKNVTWKIQDKTTTLYPESKSGYVSYLLTAKDEFNETIIAETNWFKIGGPCDEIQSKLDNSLLEQATLRKKIDSLQAVIKSLPAKADSVIIVYERVKSGVETILTKKISEVPTLNNTGDLLIVTSELPISEIQVFDVLGKKQNITYNSQSSLQVLIDKSQFDKNRMYFILVITEHKTNVFKFIK